MEGRHRSSVQQMSAILEFMERHGDLARPQPGALGRLRTDRLWEELAVILNSQGGGGSKTVAKWKKTNIIFHWSKLENATLLSPSPQSLAPPQLTFSPPPPPNPPLPQPGPSQQGQHSTSTRASPPAESRIRRRTRRAQTTFERAAEEFSSIERRPLQFDTHRAERQYKLDLRRLELEAQRNEVEIKRVNNNNKIVS